jgi:hypothetical protein
MDILIEGGTQMSLESRYCPLRRDPRGFVSGRRYRRSRARFSRALMSVNTANLPRVGQDGVLIGID